MTCFVGFTKIFRFSLHVPFYAADYDDCKKYISNESDMNVKNWSHPTRNAVVDFTKFFGNERKEKK